MPFNLLLFPLVGGYFIITRLEKYKYVNQRVDGQVLLFNSIIVGICLLIVSFLLCSASDYFFNQQVNYIRDHYFPVKDHYFGTAVVSFLLAFPITLIGNRWIEESEAISTAIDRIGNELELLFKFSCERSELIQITLKNDKVYIGWVEILPKPQQSTYVKIIPALSGYRDGTKRLHITVNYTIVYSEYIKQTRIKAIDELEMKLVIKVDEIISAIRFDWDVFEKFELLSQAGNKQTSGT